MAGQDYVDGDGQPVNLQFAEAHAGQTVLCRVCPHKLAIYESGLKIGLGFDLPACSCKIRGIGIIAASHCTGPRIVLNE